MATYQITQTPPQTPRLTVGTPMPTVTFAVTQMFPPTAKYSVSSGLLPQGTTLNTTTGVWSGTPTQAGRCTFNVHATNAQRPPDTADLQVTVDVVAAPQPVHPAVPAGLAGVAGCLVLLLCGILTLALGAWLVGQAGPSRGAALPPTAVPTALSAAAPVTPTVAIPPTAVVVVTPTAQIVVVTATPSPTAFVTPTAQIIVVTATPQPAPATGTTPAAPPQAQVSPTPGGSSIAPAAPAAPVAGNWERAANGELPKTIVLQDADGTPYNVAPDAATRMGLLRYDNGDGIHNWNVAAGQTKTVSYVINHAANPVGAWISIQKQAENARAETVTAPSGTEISRVLRSGTAWVVWTSTCPSGPLRVDVSNVTIHLAGPGCIRFVPTYGAGDRVFSFEQAVAVW